MVMLAAAWLGAARPLASGPEEDRAFEALQKLAADGFSDAAEKECVQFRGQFPGSERISEVTLLHAQMLLKLKRTDDALKDLANVPAPGQKLADEFLYWKGEALWQKGTLTESAAAFTQLSDLTPPSPRGMEAAYRAALAHFRLGQPGQASALLADPKRIFQQQLASKPDDPWALRGQLLLAETLASSGNPAASETLLTNLVPAKLTPELDWQRHFLLARLRLNARRFPEALAEATNLWSAATNVVRRELLAEAVEVHAGVLEDSQQQEAAAQMYARNLIESVPSDFRRRALQKTFELTGGPNRTSEMATRLETFLTQHPQDETLDLVRLMLGEMRLRQYTETLASAGAKPETAPILTNLLAQARAQFDTVLTVFTNSPLVGRAMLNRGWCLWYEGAPKLVESQQAFQSAVERLPQSPDQAAARFKLADTQYALRDFGGAWTNYWLVATNYTTRGLTNSLPVEALYQAVRSGLDWQHVPDAQIALAALLKADPSGERSGPAMILVAQSLAQQRQATAARSVYEDFENRFPNAEALPWVRCEIARTHEFEHALDRARTNYTLWLDRYRTSALVATTLTAQVEFDLARVSYQIKPDTNSVALLSRYIDTHPGSTNQAMALYLVGEHYFNQGDYESAERILQNRLLIENTNRVFSDLRYQARFLVFNAAIAGQRFKSAREYLDGIITNGPLYVANSTVPAAVAAKAYFLRGDTFLAEPSTNAFARYGDALTAFSKVAEFFTNTTLVPYAQGRIGDCHFQLAAQDTREAGRHYDLALTAYRAAEAAPNADAALRTLAEIGQALTLLKQAELTPAADQPPILEQALGLYLGIFYGKNLRAGETPVPDSVIQAGFAAVDLSERMKRWDAASNVCNRLLTELPALRPRIQRRIDQINEAKARTP